MQQSLKKVKQFQKQINVEKNFKWVADSALYSQDHLLKDNSYLWLSRVPETNKEAKKLLNNPPQTICWKKQSKGYKTATFNSSYGGIKQRWLLVFSEQAYQREKNTLERKITKQKQELEKLLWHMGCERFNCESDAKKALKQLKKKFNHFCIEEQLVPVYKHQRSGRPKRTECGAIIGYHLVTVYNRNSEKIEETLQKKGRFILATNDLDEENYSEHQILEEYKAQQNVEGGFRFLKDPWFMLNSVFLKLPHRVEALMMVMTLCLMVYNVAQYKLREQLRVSEETLPNQLKKEVKNPTIRWIFQLMEGIGIVLFYRNIKNIKVLVKEAITNLNPLRQKILYLLGPIVSEMYGLIQKNTTGVLGM